MSSAPTYVQVMEAKPVYAISDLHFDSVHNERRMDGLNQAWIGHPDSLLRNWQRIVPRRSVVLCPGDLSRNVRPGHLQEDYKLLDHLPGDVKVLSPGNHDYGPWRSGSQAQRFCDQFDSLRALRSNATRVAFPGDGEDPEIPGLVIAAAKGFYAPEDDLFNKSYSSTSDPKLEMKRFQRELGRLRAALRAAEELRRDGDKLAVLIHYPPFVNYNESSAFSSAIEKAGADLCLFGHIHYPEEWKRVVIGDRAGVRYQLVAADYLNMEPLRVGQLSERGFELAPLPEQPIRQRALGLRLDEQEQAILLPA